MEMIKGGIKLNTMDTDMENEVIEEYMPSESWMNMRGGTKADRAHGYGFLGQPDDFEEASIW